VSEDWEYVELSDEAYLQWRMALPGRSYLLNSAVFSKAAPTLTLSKATVLADGEDSTTMTVDLQDAAYSGAVEWRITAPDGERQTVSTEAVAGVATLVLQVAVNAVGIYAIEVETITHGVAFSQVEAE